jgi:ATP-dependent Clp protease, protease subunit
MEGNIYINGEIGADVHLANVIQQVQSNALATSYNVHINSMGGIVDVGFDIYNYLRSIGKPITTIGNGMVASIATVIFMAGDKRVLRENTEFMIHMPSGGIDNATSVEIEAYNEMLKKYDKKVVDFYIQATGLSKEAIEPLLINETWVDMELAKAMNFITEEPFKVSAKAVYNFKSNNKMTNEDRSWIEEKFAKITALFAKPIKNIILQDANGVSIEFPEVADGEDVTVGAKGLIEGQPVPDGTYIMPSLGNASVTFVGGAVSDIVAEGDSNEEMEALKQENEALKEQLATANAEVVEKESQIQAIKKEFTTLKGEVKSKFTIEPKEPKEPTNDGFKSMVEKAKQLKNKR